MLARAGVRPRKSAGQNFLVQQSVAKRIVAALDIGADDHVIEVGPGLGILTARILECGPHHLTIVELESRLVARLTERFGEDSHVTIVNADFLEVDLATLGSPSPVKIIGNLPFSAASAILRRLCERRSMIARMVLMFQREVAERIRARPGSRAYAALSVFTAMYWEIDSHFRVAAGSFHPRPKVDAEVIRFLPRVDSSFGAEEEQAVLETVRASFSAPRKTICNALENGLHVRRTSILASLARASIDAGARAETLAVTDFVRLSRALQELRNA